MEHDQKKDKSIATKPTNASSSSPAISPAYHFKIGEEVEARLNSDGLGDAWYKEEITGHDTLFNGQLAVAGYIIKHKALMQDGDSNAPKIALVQERNIRRVPAFSPQVKRLAHFNILSASASKKPKQESQRKYSNNEGERDAIALGLFVSYANLATSIETLTIDADVAVFDRLFSWANSLEKNGFNVNPIRAYLKELLKKKSEVIEERLKLSELERKFSERQKDVEIVKSEVLKQERFVRDCECVLPKLPWKN